MRLVVVAQVALACGARTGLDGPPRGAASDASSDGSADVGRDVSLDALPDVVPPPPPPPASCPYTIQTELAATDWGIDQIMVDADFVYFHTWSGVSRVAKSGGATTTLGTFSPAIWPTWSDFTVDAQVVTWAALDSAANSSTIASVPIAGGKATTIATIDGRFDGVLESSSLLVWEGHYADQLLDSIVGGTVTTVTKLPGGINQIVDRSGTLFGASSDGVFRFDGTTVTFIASMPAFTLALDDSDVFFTQAPKSQEPTAVYRVDTLGQTIAVPMTPPSADVLLGGITVAGNFVYYAQRSGTVMRIDKKGTSSVVVGSYVGQVMDVVTDGACIYFTTTNADVLSGSHVFVAPL